MCFESYQQPNLLIALIKHNVKLSEHLPCALSSLPLSTWGSERGKVGPAAEGRNLALSFSLCLAIARVEWEGGDILCRWYHHRLRRVWGRMPPPPASSPSLHSRIRARDSALILYSRAKTIFIRGWGGGGGNFLSAALNLDRSAEWLSLANVL